MAIEYKKEIERHRKVAAEQIQKYFGGEYPPYFKESLTEQCCRFDLGEALFKRAHGQITEAELDITRKMIFSYIKSIRPWGEALFNTKPGEFPKYPDYDKSKLN